MDEQHSAPEPEEADTVAKIIHGAIIGALVVAFAIFLYLQRAVGLDFPAQAARALRFAGYIVLAAAVLGSLFVRGRIKPPAPGTDVGRWWTDVMPQAVVVWALAEGGGLTAIVLGWIIDDMTLLALGTAVALALLFVTRPGRLRSEV